MIMAFPGFTMYLLVLISKVQEFSNNEHSSIRDLFHVYLTRFEFHFLRLHIIKTKFVCLFMHNERFPDIAK